MRIATARLVAEGETDALGEAELLPAPWEQVAPGKHSEQVPCVPVQKTLPVVSDV